VLSTHATSWHQPREVDKAKLAKGQSKSKLSALVLHGTSFVEKLVSRGCEPPFRPTAQAFKVGDQHNKADVAMPEMLIKLWQAGADT